MSIPILTSGYNFTPLSNITPFTYRDGETFLEQLCRLRGHIDDMVGVLQANIDIVKGDDEQAILDITAQFNAIISDINNQLIEVINGGNDVAYDPTKGSIESVQTVLGHVYDNTRYYAYFAEQLDSFDKTALQWDAYQYTARHFDLALAYSPTQVQDENDVPSTVQPFMG